MPSALVSLARHLGYQADDAVTQTARLAPQDCGLADLLARNVADLTAFAEREGAAAAFQIAGASALPEPPQVPADARAGRIYRLARWAAPTKYELPAAVWGRIETGLGAGGDVPATRRIHL